MCLDLTHIMLCPACGKRPELRAGWSFWIECECGEESDGWMDIECAIRDWNDSAKEAIGGSAVLPGGTPQPVKCSKCGGLRHGPECASKGMETPTPD